MSTVEDELETCVKGYVGQERFGYLLAGSCLASVCIFCLLRSLQFFLGVLAIAAFMVAVLYNLCVDGPWRCVDVAVPMHFELNAAILKVTEPVLAITHAPFDQTRSRWVFSCCHRSRRFPSDQVESIDVYRQTYSYAAPWKTRRLGRVEKIQNPEQVHSNLPYFASLVQVFRCSQAHHNCAFLGASIRGHTEPVPLSVRVWHARGLDELFRLKCAVCQFRSSDGQGFGGSPGLGTVRQARVAATEERIAALPRHTHSLCSLRSPERIPDVVSFQEIVTEPNPALFLDSPRRCLSPSECNGAEMLVPARSWDCGDIEAPLAFASTGTSGQINGDVVAEEVGADQLATDSVECAICLMTMADGDVSCTMPCGHYFHFECAVRWLRVDCRCPLCKAEL